MVVNSRRRDTRPRRPTAEEQGTVRERQLRRRCRSLLRELDIRPPLDVAALCANLADYRGRPIRLVDYPFPVPGPFGVWLAMERADYIFYQRETSPAHQVHITLHEIGHLVADHDGGGGDDELLGLLSPGARPETVWRALRRTSYDTEQEHAAETVATLILQWASVLDAVVPRLSAGSAERRMHGALGDRMGWL
jgi:hypothetical protein